MGRSAADATFDAKIGKAAQAGDLFARAQEQVQDWLITQSKTLGVGYASVPMPTPREWGELSAGRRAPLPNPELVFSNLARWGYKERSSAERLRVIWGMGVIALDPTQDPKYVRNTMDDKDILPDVRFHPKNNGEQTIGVGRVSTSYVLFDKKVPVGTAATVSLQQNESNETWLSDLRFLATANTLDYRMAAHIVGAEHADALGQAFRTPIEAATEPTLHQKTAQVWKRLIEKGVAQEVMPFKEADDKYMGHAVIPARVWRG